MDCHVRHDSSPSARFCSSCGARLGEGPQSNPGLRDHLLDDAPIIVLWLDPNGRIQYFNRFMENLGGYRLAEVQGQDWFTTFLPARDRDRIRSFYRGALSGKPTQGNRNPIVTRNGEEREIQWFDKRLIDEADRMVGLLAVGQDVTELHRSEAELRLKDAIVEQMVAGVLVIRVGDGALIYANRQFAELLGYEPREILGRSIHVLADRVHPDDRQIFWDETKRFYRERSVFRLEYRVQQKDRTSITVEHSGTVLRDANGSPTQILGFLQDISARERIKQQVLESEQRLRQIVEAMPVLMDAFDDTGHIVAWNRECERVTGYSADEILMNPRAMDMLYPDPTYRAQLAEGWKKRRNNFRDWELDITCKDGSLRTIAWSHVSEQFPIPGWMAWGIGVDVTERKRAEAESRASEARLRAILDSSPECVKLIDLESRLVEMNQSGLAMVQADSIDQLRGHCVLDLVRPEYRESFRKCVLEAKEGKTTFLEYEIEGLRGARRWMEQHAVGLRDPRAPHDITHIISVTRDITDRKRIADRDAERLAKLKRLADLSLKLSGDPSTVFTHIVRMIGELFDVPVVCLSEIVGEELLFKAVYKDGQVVSDPGSCPLAVTPCMQVERFKKIQIFDRVAERYPQASFLRECNAVSYCGFPSVDSEEQVVAVTCLLDSRAREFSNEDQQILRVIGQRIAIEVERSRSLEARRRDRNAVRESEERLRLLVENAPAGVAMLDRDLRYLAYSRRWLTDYQLGDQNLTGRSHYEVFPETPDRWKEIHRRCLAGGSEQCEEDILERADGSVDYLRWEIQPWRDAAGAVGGLVFFTELITDRKRSEQQLRQLRDELAHVARLGTMGEMASGLAHELNQPLTAIHLFASAALELAQSSNVSEFRDCLRSISQQSLRAGEIIRRMRSFVRRTPSRRVPADGNQLVREVLLLLEYELQQKKIEVELDLDENLPSLQVDGIQIQQVLVNLIRNAIEAMSGVPEGGRTLSIRTQSVTDEVHVSVTDTGCGIDPGIAARLFQPFQSTGSTGLGLGLAISRSIIAAHDGRISAVPNRNGGTTFLFSLPTARDETRE